MDRQRQTRRDLLHQIEELQREVERLRSPMASAPQPGREPTATDEQVALQLCEFHFHNIAEALPLGTFLFHLEPDGRLVVIEANQAASRILGIDCQTCVGKTIEECFPQLSRTEIPARYRQLAAQGGVWQTEREYKDERVEGTFHVVAFQIGPGATGVLFMDVTARMRAEEQLRLNEARFREILNGVPVGVCLARENGEILTANDMFLRITGYSRPQLEQGLVRWDAITPQEFIALDQLAIQNVRAGQTVQYLEKEYIHADGHRVPVLIGLAETVESRELIAFVVDLTERHHTERTLLEHTRKLQLLARATQEINSLLDDQEILRRLVDIACEVTGAESGAAGRQAGEEMLFSEYHHAGTIQPMDLRFKPGSGVPGWVMQHMTTYLSNDAEHDPHVIPELQRALGFYNLINTPVISREGKLIGLFEIHNKRDHAPFGEQDAMLLRSLADSAAVALENARLYQALREADRRKDEFLATLSHELRNPLAPLGICVQKLRLRLSDSGALGDLEIIDRQVRQIVRIVDDLLDVSRITRGKIELKRELVNIGEAIEHAITAIRSLIEANRHELTLHQPETPLWLHADPTRLEQILVNLLSNAAKYTDPGGQIGITVQAMEAQVPTEPEMIEIRVRDNGMGIAPEVLPRLFELFAQGNASPARVAGGIGIGLSLVRKLAQMHGGDVQAFSAGVGQGSEFVVRLPAAAPPVRKGAQPAPPPPEAAGKREGRPAGKCRVMVVDDNKDAVTSLGGLLETWGYPVFYAYDGQVALDNVRNVQPDIMLLDIRMPGLSGYDVARRLRAEGFKSLVLVALTGYGQEEDRRKAREAGFDHHFTKPVNTEALQLLLGAICSLRYTSA